MNKSAFTRKFGVTPEQAVERFHAYLKSLNDKRFDKFDWDPSGMPAYVKDTMPEVITDIVGENNLMSRFNIMDGVKGKARINLMKGEIELQEFTGCTTSPDGSVILTDEEIEVSNLYAGIEFCNEVLNGKTTEILNSIGVKGQNDHIPYEIEQVLMIYLTRVVQRSVQNLLLLGDTLSLDANLNIRDGLVKLWDADSTIPSVNYAGTTINSVNAYAIVEAMLNNLNADMSASGEDIIVLTGNDVVRAVVMSYNKMYSHAPMNVPIDGQSVVMPLWGVTLTGVQQLNGKNKIYVVPARFMFLATDSEDDMSLDIKYDNYNDKLKVETKFRLGWNYVYPKYFLKLNLVTPGAVPTLTSLTPNTGDPADTITLVGTNFIGATAVNFGSTPGVDLAVIDALNATVKVPALASGTYNVSITTANGTSNTVQFTVN